MKPTSSSVILSTGREVNANEGILAVSEGREDWGKNGDVVLTDGYDGYSYADSNESPLTKEEKLEIANYYIGLWKKWANIT